jgi:tetratricopeptide (TPR) repeat protein
MRKIALLTVAVVLVASGAWAQQWKGSGHLTGKVVDEQGKGLEGVNVQATFPEAVGAVLEGKTNSKGEWSIDEVGEGVWTLAFEKDGYDPGKGSADVDETGRAPSVRTTLKKSFNPNEFIKSEVARADALLGQKKYAEARAVYEGIAKRVPDVAGSMQPYLARTYLLEGNKEKGIEALKATLAKDPNNFPIKVTLVGVLCETGAVDEATRMAETVDESKLTDPAMYLSLGAALANQKKSAESVSYFDKAIARFPQAPEAYLYRANVLIPLINEEKDPKNALRIERVGKIRSDLNKYLQLVPNSPQADQIKKLLADLDKA